MRGYGTNNAGQLYSVSGTFGDAQIVATPSRILLDLQSRNYDTAGILRQSHALADLPLATAIRLRELLGEAIAVASDVAPAQPGIWGPAVERTRRIA
jgi:hypothetical protein